MESSSEPLRSAAPGIAYFDLKSPYAYLAAIETLEMEERLGLRLEWRPLTLDIPSYLGSAKLAADGSVAESERSEEQWRAVKYAYFDCRRYASLRGVTVRGTVKIWDTRPAHVAMRWAAEMGDDDAARRFLLGAYEPFWRRELDAESVPALLELLDRADVPTEGFEQFLHGEGGERHDAEQAALFDAGIFGVPTYVVGDEVWFGREHLPRVEWLLSGSSGSAPDVVYRLPDSASHSANPATTFSGPVVVAIDVTQPESYLFYTTTRPLFERLGVSVRWRPFAAQPAAEASDSERSGRHMALRRFERKKQLRTAARTLDVRLDPVRGNGRHAHLLLLRADEEGRGSEAIAALLEAAWEKRQDIDDPAVLDAMAAALEISRPDPVADSALDKEREKLGNAGVVDAPGALLGAEYFLGRSHSALLESRLKDERADG